MLNVAYQRSALWNDAPVQKALENPQDYIMLTDDFLFFDEEETTGQGWLVDNATAGTAALTDGHGGLLLMDAASTTADQGVQIQLAKEYFKPQTGVNIWFEAYLAITNTSNQFFAGLSVNDTSLFASGENSSANHVGFEMNATSIAANAGKLQFYGEKAGTRGTVANVGTPTTATYYRIGFKIVGTTRIEIYYNGAKNATILGTAYIPQTELTPTFAVLSEGTTQPTIHLDWLRILATRA